MMLHHEIDERRATPLPALRWRSVVWWPLLVVLGVLAGIVGGWQLGGRAPAEGSAPVTFARDMAAHHDQAVEMATLMRDRTTDEKLRAFTLDIMLTQTAQRGQMQGWLASWGLPLVNGAPMQGMGEMMGMATQAQVNELKSLPVAQAETQFLQLMIRHHQAGVAMAQAALKQTRQPEVMRLADSIVQGQQSEIAYMQQLLALRGGAPKPAKPVQCQHGSSSP